MFILKILDYIFALLLMAYVAICLTIKEISFMLKNMFNGDKNNE